jgi:hypothetical protein
LLLALTIVLSGCTSDDEEDSGDPLSCSLNTSFSEGSPASGSIILQTAATSCGRLSLDVTLTGISNVFTIGFDVTYPAGMLSLDGYSEGPLLSQGSPATSPFFSVAEIGPGRIAVFATRFSPDGDVHAPGDTVLLTLNFRANSIGEGTIVFDLSTSPVEEQVLDSSGARVSATFANGSNLARVY